MALKTQRHTAPQRVPVGSKFNFVQTLGHTRLGYASPSATTGKMGFVPSNHLEIVMNDGEKGGHTRRHICLLDFKKDASSQKVSKKDGRMRGLIQAMVGIACAWATCLAGFRPAAGAVIREICACGDEKRVFSACSPQERMRVRMKRARMMDRWKMDETQSDHRAAGTVRASRGSIVHELVAPTGNTAFVHHGSGMVMIVAATAGREVRRCRAALEMEGVTIAGWGELCAKIRGPPARGGSMPTGVVPRL